MGMLDSMTEMMNTDVAVVGFTNGAIGPDGNPARVEVSRYADKAAWWRASSSEVFRMDRTGNKALYNLVMFPDRILSPIQVDDVVRVAGKEYRIIAGESNIMGMGDVAWYPCEEVE